MVDGYPGLSNGGVPFVVLGAGTPTLLVVPGVEPEYQEPGGLRLQGVRGAFEELAKHRTLIVAWRADRGEPAVEAVATDYLALADELGMRTFSVLSISSGAPFAIELAARAASRCSALAIVSGGARLSPAGKALVAGVRAAAAEGRWRLVAYRQVRALYPGAWGAFLAWVAWLVPEVYGAPEDAGFFNALMHVVETTDGERAADVSSPVVVINGDRDAYYPPESLDAGAFARCEIVLIPGEGHGVFKSRADAVWAHVDRFLPA